MTSSLVTLLAVLLIAAPLFAEDMPADFQESHPGGMAGIGLLSGGVGLVAGMTAGVSFFGGDENKMFDGLEEGFYIGSTLGALGLACRLSF